MGDKYYVTVCSRHKVHNEECMACRNFDKEVKDYLSSYMLPPAQHPAVVAIQTREWIEKNFPLIKP